MCELAFISYAWWLLIGIVQKSEGSLFLSDLKQKLLLPQNETSVAGTRYNVPLINSLVLYVGIQVSLILSCSILSDLLSAILPLTLCMHKCSGFATATNGV